MNSDHPQISLDSSWGLTSFEVIHKAPFRNLLRIQRPDSIYILPNSHFHSIKTTNHVENGTFSFCNVSIHSNFRDHMLFVSRSSFEDCQRVSDFLHQHFL